MLSSTDSNLISPNYKLYMYHNIINYRKKDYEDERPKLKRAFREDSRLLRKKWNMVSIT